MDRKEDSSPEIDTAIVTDDDDNINDNTESNDVALDDFDDNDATGGGIERDTNSSVRVAVRVRPILAFEKGFDNCMEVMKANHADTCSTVIRVGGQESGPRFTFDQVFDCSTHQDELFDSAVSNLVSCCLEGYNATILAYGQTGSGKTHTMMGPSPANLSSRKRRLEADKEDVNMSTFSIDEMNDHPEEEGNDDDPDSAGIIPRAFQNLFSLLEEKKASSIQSTTLFDYQVSIQLLELYGEEIRDLLTGNNRNKKLTIRDLGTDEPEVVGATQQVVATAEEALLCLSHGMLRRVTGATAMNESSSRSHAILSLLVEQQETMQITNSGEGGYNIGAEDGRSDRNNLNPADHVQSTHSRFNFVDLAGSERQKRTQAQGKRLKEGIDINKGLLVLGNVISALGDPTKRGKTFVPYRDSKLTRLLKGSLGGNHKTLMIACVSPASSNMEESLNCLRYANRAKNIQNNAIVNVDGNSRVVQELQTHVQILATDLVRILDTNNIEQHRIITSYPRNVLETLASGNTQVGVVAPTPKRGMSSHETPSSPAPLYQSNGNSEVNLKLREMEIELSKTKDQLRQSRNNHDSAEEQLYIVKAQKELSDLQLSVLKDRSNTFATNGNSGAVITDAYIQEAFLQRTITYEKEIGQLKASLQETDSKLERMKWAMKQSVNSHDHRSKEEDEQQQHFIELATKQLEVDRSQLPNLQSSFSEHMEKDENDPIDVEQLEDEADILHLTKKYLANSSDEDFDYVDRGSPSRKAFGLTSDRKSKLAGVSDSTHPTSTSQRERKVQADLAELTRSITSKENLIDQLKLSQEKYASMRDFYEDRLRQMDDMLREKEREREALLRDLKRLKDGGHAGSKEIEEKLGQKEKHIADLRKKQQELVKLTAVSSRNDLEISRLHDDVQNMKRLKVDLQRKLSDERKAHLKQMKELQKAALLQDKELSKVKRISNKREIEATRAQQVAKQRMDELAQLRLKYKDSEKKLRMASLKRGVLAKAGIDPVIVGRRENGLSPRNSNEVHHHFSRRQGVARVGLDESNKLGAISVDTLRSYFDEKVAGVVRKEAIVDKLAREWEEHFELSNRKQELISQKSALGDNEELEDAHQALLIQIQFKEERIRRLASRLGKPEESPDKIEDIKVPQSETFLFGKEFVAICKGSKPDKARAVAARVLFGMIVRERRRVAALARTASSLDERVQEAERAAELSEDALRSYMEEQRDELAALTQNQQEHILSLMDMVREDSIRATSSPYATDSTEKGHSEEIFQRKLLVLANERVSLLERQIAELQTEAAENNSYREKLEEMKDSLSTKLQDYENIRNDLRDLRGALRHLREVLNLRDDTSDQGLRSILLETINNALNAVDGEVISGFTATTPSGSKVKRSLRTSLSRGKQICPQPIEAFLTDSEDENETVEEVPDWANDIMADLALIAEGILPPSMENTPAVIEGVTQLERNQLQPSKVAGERKSNSVFDRLSNPKQYTGTQKLVQRNTKQISSTSRPSGGAKSSPSVSAQRRREERKAMSKEINSRLDKILVPPAPASRSSDDHEGSLLQMHADSEAAKGHQSVFDRLVSPSHYTGTQKEKFQETKQKRERTADQVADRLLDGLLQSKEAVVKAGGDSHEYAVSRNHSLYTEYASKDVFERLQKTTTQAFAVKTHALSAFEGQPLHHSDESHGRWYQHDESTSAIPSTSDHAAKPTSASGASGRQETSPQESSGPTFEKHVHSDYMRQDVFERLQKTTTEAYAKKASSRHYHHHDDS